jgi:hypothetical protein
MTAEVARQRCQGCGYDLSAPAEGDPQPRCPECGLHFLPGSHPAIDWPGARAVFFEASGLFLALLALGVCIAAMPTGMPLGLAVLVPAGVIGLITPVQAAKAYGARFPTHAARWKSRRRIWLISMTINVGAMLGVLAILRQVHIR